ncbi:MAG: acyl-CoA ligase (AMP-forming), exosortase A system-associated [Pontixanthobacter sp.]
MQHRLNPESKPLDHLATIGVDGDPALVLKDRTLTYADLRDRVARLAGWLTAQSLPAGARVATWAAKGELTCLMPLAAARAGLVHVPINPLLKHTQVAHILQDSGASALIGTQARLETLDGDPPLRKCAMFDELMVLRSLPAVCPLSEPSNADTDDLAAILYTSGSTGKPKGVMLSHANLWIGAVSVARYLQLKADDVTLCVLPFAFDYGQNQLLSSWYVGASAVPLDYLFPKDVFKACEKHGVTTLAAVPPLWHQLVEASSSVSVTKTLRRITNSGGALTQSLIEKLRQTFPDTQIYPMYGLTEAFRSTYLPPELVATKPTSIGSAIPFAEILVVNTEGEPVDIGEEGELVHCGPLVAQGYWNDPERTAHRFKTAPSHSQYGGVAVWSGDRVVQDRDGHLHFVGRHDAMIKSAGNRISPHEIEDAARQTGLVGEAVALGIPNEMLGHAIHLFVTPMRATETAARTNDIIQLQGELAHILPNFMQPHQIYWRDTLPLNPNGKLDRAALAKDIGA